MNRHQIVRLLVAAVVAVVQVAGAAASAAQPGQGEFVPIKDVARAEVLPAAPLLIAAYAVVWAALLLFVWSVWRRLGALSRDLAELRRRVGKQPKA